MKISRQRTLINALEDINMFVGRKLPLSEINQYLEESSISLNTINYS
ncbi:hypothetical protein J5U22_00937 [Saccharolobus shibatae]|uniref:Uncharacterized protein n=1 Tax=Saccharolobus shibatae TaxID=2286 RepID=A0A8F5BZR7_9CREN|nr:hypothetical protein J5U22_00937 [Saccharolobus shibatae]